MRNLTWIFVALGMILILGGCATKPTDPEQLRIYEQNNDPLEPMNRTIFGFNMAVDRLVLKPAAKGYRTVVPSPVRKGVNNFFNNLKQPVYFVNALLQGEGKAAGQIAGRFAANTFWGFFGIFDTASQMDIPVDKRDFGETLAVWGVENGGPYLVLPILGPSNVRDTAGIGVDSFLAPVDWALRHEPWLVYGVWGVNGFRVREQALDFLDSLERSSTDLYATMRSMYQQNRKKEIDELLKNPNMPESAPAYEFDFPDEFSDDE